MSTYVHLIAETKLELWGLTSRERLRRVLARVGVTDFADDLGEVPDGASVLLLRADYLYDNRVLNGLIATPDVVLFTAEGSVAVAAHVSSSAAIRVRACLDVDGGADIPDGLSTATPETIGAGFETKLRKLGKPYVLEIKQENLTALEKQLFDGSYKGVTDLVTKWVWPAPARWVTWACARLKILPNHVTGLSWLLAILAAYLFAEGMFGWGLVVGWLMTFLDTVDGKLARVTVTYTNFGNFFDHILDLMHPPFWYLAWAIGLAKYGAEMPWFSLSTTVWLIFAGYILGRVAEGLFRRRLGDFSIFAWRPIDSYSRLITARRNPCLILLTGGLAMDMPGEGLLAVVIWTLVSTLFLWARVATAWRERATGGALRPWMAATEGEIQQASLAYRWFAN